MGQMRCVGVGQVEFWCPGCDRLHYLDVRSPVGIVADVVKRTVVSWLRDSRGDMTVRPLNGCYFFIHDGAIYFRGDCGHRLAGKGVSLPDLPDNPEKASRPNAGFVTRDEYDGLMVTLLRKMARLEELLSRPDQGANVVREADRRMSGVKDGLKVEIKEGE